MRQAIPERVEHGQEAVVLLQLGQRPRRGLCWKRKKERKKHGVRACGQHQRHENCAAVALTHRQGAGEAHAKGAHNNGQHVVLRNVDLAELHKRAAGADKLQSLLKGDLRKGRAAAIGRVGDPGAGQRRAAMPCGGWRVAAPESTARS